MPITNTQDGKDFRVYVNTGTEAADGTGTFTEVDLATDVTVDESKDSEDSTNRQSARSGWKAAKQGLKAFEVSFDMHLAAVAETPNAAVTHIVDAFYSGDTIEIVVSPGDIVLGTSIPARFAVVTVGGGSESHPLTGVSTKAVALTNVGAVLRGTYTTNTPTLS